MTTEQNWRTSYFKAISDAWKGFMDERGLYYGEMPHEQGDLVGKAFMAGWTQGLGSLNE